MQDPTTISIGIVAPVWLQEPLAVLFNASLFTRLWGCATTVEALLDLQAEGPPKIVLLYTSSEETAGQVGQVKAAWPGARSVVLVERFIQQAEAEQAGADAVLSEGVAPQRLLTTIEELFGAGSGRRASAGG